LLRARFKAGDVGAQQLGEIDAAAQQAADLTRKLLGFSRRANLSLRPVRLGDIVGDVVALLRPTLDPKIELELAAPAADTSDVVVADRSEMCHVVLNLCLNARDAMLRGGRMSMGVGRCVVDAAHAARVPGGQAGDMVYLSVADTGPGIPREVVARIFEPFFTTKPTGEGTGLGLAVARGIVEQHQGFMECATSAAGSCFTIYLPPHQGSRAPDAGPGRPPGAEGARRGETILFVDDEPPLRRLASRILGRNGYEVLLAPDGAEALAVFHAEIEAIDLVIVDLTMPRMSGVEVVQSLREIRPDVRIILSTGHIGDEARTVEQLQSVTVLPKPYTVDQLLGTVRRLLDEKP
jgi:CheY-like chemotaxis protein